MTTSARLRIPIIEYDTLGYDISFPELKYESTFVTPDIKFASNIIIRLVKMVLI